MAQLVPIYELRIGDLRSCLPRVEEPHLKMPYFAFQSVAGQLAGTLSNTVYLAEHNVIILLPLWERKSQGVEGIGADIVWSGSHSPSTNSWEYNAVPSDFFSLMPSYIVNKTEAQSWDYSTTGKWQIGIFECYLSPGGRVKGSNQGQGDEVDVCFLCGNVWVKVSARRGALSRISYTTDSDPKNATWTDVFFNDRRGSIVPGKETGSREVLFRIEISFFNHVCRVVYGETIVPVRIGSFGSGNSGIITQVRVLWNREAGKTMPLRWRWVPATFPLSGSFQSQAMPLGFQPTQFYFEAYLPASLNALRQVFLNDVTQYLDFPPGSSVLFHADFAALEVAWTCVINRGNEAHLTPAIARVDFVVPGRWTVYAPSETVVKFRSFTEQIHFDPSSLTIVRSGSATMTNFHGELAGLGGQRFVRARMGYLGGALVPRGAGILHQYHYSRPSANVSVLTVQWEGLEKILRDQMIVYLPSLDGWNHYYAIAYLAQLGGIPLSLMAFRDYVPEDPYSATPLDTNPFFLPLGEGGVPRVLFSEGTSLWEAMSAIQQITGFLLFFDANGFLRYEPWSLDRYVFTPIKQVFSSASGGDPSKEIWELSITVDMEPVRNEVYVVGWDWWRMVPMAAFRRDIESIYSVYNVPPNFIGYPKRAIWRDARFAVPSFLAQAAERLFQWLRRPAVIASFQTWFQPNLFPLDVITIEEDKTGWGGGKWLVLGVAVNVNAGASGVQAVTTVTARKIL